MRCTNLIAILRHCLQTDVLWLLWQFDTSSCYSLFFSFVGLSIFHYPSIRESIQPVIYVATRIEKYHAASWAWLIPGRQQNYSAQQNFCDSNVLVCARPPSTRHIKSAGLLSRRVGSSTGMKYRFSIGHSLTLGRFRIKLPGPRVWSIFVPFL